MKLMIGVPTRDTGFRPEFYDYLEICEKPIGTMIMRAHGQSPARNRNIIIQAALEQDCTHILFFDDDIAMPANAVMDIIKHEHLDAVTGLYLMRAYPHQPIVFDTSRPDGQCEFHFLRDGETGLFPARNAGLGCCLIKTDVFKVMEKPWVRLGELEKDHWCDDIGFFNRFHEAGFKLWCDLDIRCGHMATCTVWPVLNDGKWFTSYETRGSEVVTFKAVQPAYDYSK